MPSSLPFRSSDSQFRIELDYGWEFLPDPSAKLTIRDLDQATGWRNARAGLSWNVQFDDLREYMGAAWYQIRLELPSGRNLRHVLLKFGAVDYFCEVYLNGVAVGTHEGGYTPFSFDLSRFVSEGENLLAVRVIDPPMDEQQNRELFPDMLYNEIPHGKQNWYVQNSGMWQGVRLELTPAIYVDRIDVTPKIDGRFELDIKLAGDGVGDPDNAKSGTTLKSIIFDNSGRVVWEHQCSLPESDRLVLTGQLKDHKLWGPDHPFLYTIDVQLEGAVRYRRRARFGFRELRAQDGQLFFNGQPFYMIAALDQDFYPETIHTPASEEFVREMMLRAKRLGINTLRCHLKVAHPVYLDMANELGMLVWAELPSWSDCWFPADHFSHKAAARTERMFEEMMLRDWNHPCLVIQTILNESWGIDLKDAQQRQWLKQTFDKVSSVLHPLGRLVIDNSACEGNFHLKTDIEDFHNYYSQPDQASLWDKFVAEFARRASWTYSPFGDRESTGREPLIISEFGNWGLPQLPKELPWWFSQSFGEREVTRPAGVFERFHQYQLGRVFNDYDDFAIQTQWHQFASLKYEMESMRREERIRGYCVTGMTDVHWEVNGLLDMWRNEKVFAEDLRRLQQRDLVMLDVPKANFYSGETVQIPVALSHFSAKETAGSTIRWSIESGPSGTVQDVPSIASGTVAQLATLNVQMPSIDDPVRLNFRVELRARDGSLSSENSYSLFVFPRVQAVLGEILFHDPFGTLEPTIAWIRTLGTQADALRDNASPGKPLLASVLDRTVLQHLAAGGLALVLADSDQAFAPDTRLTCLKRAGNWLDGRWFSNYNWIDPTAQPYRKIAFNRILGFESRQVVPAYVIGGVAPESFQHAISGITLGWLQLNHPLTLRAGIGEGRALITTFRFPSCGTDPYSSHLLREYLNYVAKGDWGTQLELSANLLADQEA